MAEYEHFLTSAYDCEWCVPYQPNVGPVTHHQTDAAFGDERYAEHWLSRDRDSLRHVLVFRAVDPSAPAPIDAKQVRPVTTKAKGGTTRTMKKARA